MMMSCNRLVFLDKFCGTMGAILAVNLEFQFFGAHLSKSKLLHSQVISSCWWGVSYRCCVLQMCCKSGKYLQRDRAFNIGDPLVVLHTLLTCIDQLRVEVSHGASYMHGTLTCVDQLRVEAMELATCMGHFVQSQ